MLARMLRFFLALAVLGGAALGVWLSGPGPLPDSVRGAMLGASAGVLLSALFTVSNILVSASVSRADEPAAIWWRATLGECLASVQIFLLRQPWSWAPPAVQASQAPHQRIPVLLVHGFICNHRLWDVMAPALRAQGHTVLAIDLEPVFASIDDYVPRLEQAVQSLRQHTGAERVALVGHSMGGLAIRAWMRRFGTAHAAGAITLGTPHRGTRLQALFPRWQAAPNGLQMAWHSDWLQTLETAETDVTRALLRIGLSPQDNIVFPQRAQTVPGTTAVVFDGLGHLQLITAARVIRWVCSELALM